MNKETLHKSIVITTLILVLSMLLFEVNNIDITIQNWFYNFNLNEWIVDRDNAVLKFIFYDGIKKTLIIFAVIVLISLIFGRKNKLLQTYKTGLLIIVFSAVLVPSVIGWLKTITNTPCPKNLAYFNGCYPYVKVFDRYPSTFKQKEKMECFPAGHASGGFALFSLFFLFKSRKNKIMALLFAMVIGWSMGIYKMLIGDHFFSHTFITMIISWLIVLIVVKLQTIMIELKVKNIGENIRRTL
ncbi:MAG: phosphatase PAP2 family protein [Desulfamplus sp.]|nr:phosphatase PAP2 family protein [Desulfamplus sp.]